ncbi:Uncharacterised protein [Salmonella enterica subsp. salamae]|nr:Uncharacterised protein [Salmonella enterica subsp. salamae]
MHTQRQQWVWRQGTGRERLGKVRLCVRPQEVLQGAWVDAMAMGNGGSVHVQVVDSAARLPQGGQPMWFWLDQTHEEEDPVYHGRGFAPLSASVALAPVGEPLGFDMNYVAGWATRHVRPLCRDDKRSRGAKSPAPPWPT